MEEIRKLHNKVKKTLIQKWVKAGDRVLDCGCGRGGDFWKWRDVGAKVVAIDPDGPSLEEARRRLKEINADIQVAQGDVRDAVALGKFDVVCYNFSIHYIFSDPILFQNSIEALGAIVPKGGLVIGITPDGSRMNFESKFMDPLGNTLEKNGDRLLVNLVDGPFYKDGPKEEPILDQNSFLKAMSKAGFVTIVWDTMLDRPNGHVSDFYTKFVFRKKY
jgi:ubiquinone/menaquinone biosynthesis C-methylase UbiE